jgi:methionyl-tRNA formyltransferase
MHSTSTIDPGTVDLYLSPTSAWVLRAVRAEQVRRVFTSGVPVTNAAAGLGIETLSGDPNALGFEPAAVGVSVHYPRKLSAALLARYRVIYNLHPGYLPWCRGLWSVNWALWENAPVGATLHEMTTELDAGPIVDRIRVAYGPDDLCGEVQRRVDQAERELLHRYWSRIAGGEALPAEPQSEPGSAHTARQTADLLRGLKRETRWRAMSAGDLVAALRSFGQLDIEHGGRVLQLYVGANAPPSDGGGQDRD